MSAFVSAVIVAAGGSVRMGIADSKQFIPLLSRPAIEYTLKAFQKCHLIKEIVIVCREQDNDRTVSTRFQNLSRAVTAVPTACLTESVRAVKTPNTMLFMTVQDRLLPLKKLSVLLRRLLIRVRQLSELP